MSIKLECFPLKSFSNLVSNLLGSFLSYEENEVILKVVLEVDLIKPFGANLLTGLCKVNHFINVYNICHSVVKRSSLQKD